MFLLYNTKVCVAKILELKKISFKKLHVIPLMTFKNKQSNQIMWKHILLINCILVHK